MASLLAVPPTLKQRFARLSFIGLLVAVSFMLGATVTAVIAARILLPIAAAGMAMGLVGLASLGATATIDVLRNGDSENRKTVLAGLKQSLTSQPPIDPQLANWILPALDQCMTDKDPQVVVLAMEVKAVVQGTPDDQQE